MLPLTRFWSLILVLGAVAGVAVAMIGTHVIDERTDDAAVAALARDRFELEALLKLDARARIDAIAPVAANGDVRTALRTATGRAAGAEIDETLMTNLHARLGELNGQLGEMAGDLVFGVDANGIIVAQVGGTPPPHGAGLGAFPLVRRALDGYVRDDVWVYNGETYRMAARPVIDAGQYVGAVILGKRFDDAFAARLVTRLSGASLAFFLRDQVVASAMPATGDAGIPRNEIGTPLAAVITAAEWDAGQLSPPQDLATGGVAVFAPVVGSASYAHFGYALGRPRPRLGSPTAILSLASSEDWARLPWPMLGGIAFLLFVIAMFTIWLEHSRPLTHFRVAADKLGKRDLDRLVPPEFGGQLRTAAASINEALDKVQDAAAATGSRRKAADLDQILGKAPEASSPAFFGFGEDKSRSSGGDFDLPPVPPAAPPPAAPAPSSPAIPKPPLAPPAAAPVPAPPAPAAKPAAPPAPAVPAPPGKPAAPERPKLQDPLGTTMIGVGSGGTSGIGMVQAQAVSRPPTPAAPPPPADDGGDDEDGATMVAKVPDELLKRAGSEEAEQEAHYRDVFEQFLATKKQCNEPVVGLTFDKFVVTLRKNREQIVQKHGAAKVRFTVYVKEGKAALKATPIKE